MILTGTRIGQEVLRGRIAIAPFDVAQLNPNSYNYRLGSTLMFATHGLQDAGHGAGFTAIDIPSRGVVLQPNQLYLGSTVEAIGSDFYVPLLIGRSSLGRLGLFLQVSADLGQTGLTHCWTLELVASQPIRLYSGMLIGQVSFWRPLGRRSLYSGRYTDTHLPTASRFSYAASARPRSGINRKLRK